MSDFEQAIMRLHLMNRSNAINDIDTIIGGIRALQSELREVRVKASFACGVLRGIKMEYHARIHENTETAITEAIARLESTLAAESNQFESGTAQ